MLFLRTSAMDSPTTGPMSDHSDMFNNLAREQGQTVSPFNHAQYRHWEAIIQVESCVEQAL